eukprot:XP_001706147.1 Hypothetical protein GL50803_37010 [Giardia lamblia ATCC 50803]
MFVSFIELSCQRYNDIFLFQQHLSVLLNVPLLIKKLVSL